jgi:hypothetical protein
MSATPAPSKPATCRGCYRTEGGGTACYRLSWQHPPCLCEWCAVRRSNGATASLSVEEDDPGDMGEPSIEWQRQEAASQGTLRQILNRETLIVCDYDEARPKHSRCGDRLTPSYEWVRPDALVASDVTYCEACSRRTALKPEVKVQPCSSCGALMFWGTGARGGKLPISVKTGDSHFRDCPDAARHSKRGRK